MKKKIYNVAVVGYGLSGKVTRIEPDSSENLETFRTRLRENLVLAQPESLAVSVDLSPAVAAQVDTLVEMLVEETLEACHPSTKAVKTFLTGRGVTGLQPTNRVSQRLSSGTNITTISPAARMSMKGQMPWMISCKLLLAIPSMT